MYIDGLLAYFKNSRKNDSSDFGFLDGPIVQRPPGVDDADHILLNYILVSVTFPYIVEKLLRRVLCHQLIKTLKNV